MIATAQPIGFLPRRGPPFPTRDLGRECVEAVGPEGAEAVEPGVDFGERSGVDGIEPAGAGRTDGGEAGFAQHLQVLAHRRLGDAELPPDDFDDLARGVLPLREEFEDAPPDGVAEDVEGVHSAPGAASPV